MAVPTTIDDLDTVAANNGPAGTESVASVDDYLRAHASFIAQVREGDAGAISTTDPGYNGMWPDVTAATKIFRLRDRLFVGDGAAFTGGSFVDL